jgi:hypothetical protein
MFNNFYSENRVVYEIMSKLYSRVRQVRVNNIIQRMLFACWINKATNTLRIGNTYCSSTATKVFECA